MIHERTGSASTYYGVDFDQRTAPDGRGGLMSRSLTQTVAQAGPGAAPGTG